MIRVEDLTDQEKEGSVTSGFGGVKVNFAILCFFVWQFYVLKIIIGVYGV